MLKRLFCLLLCGLLLGLCGCDRTAAYREPEQIVIVTALGFDGGEAGYTVTAETVDQTGDTEQIYHPMLLKGEGVTVEQALADISDTLGGTLFFSHCAIIVLGQSLSAEQTGRIVDFCKTEDQITLATRLISTENAEELLNCRGHSSGMLGYDFLLLFQTESGQALPPYEATLYQTCALRLEDAKVYTIPCFAVKQEDDEPVYTPAGFSIYAGDAYLSTLDGADYTVYKMLTGSFHPADVCFDGGGQPLQARVDGSDCSVLPTVREDGTLTLRFDVTLTVDPSRVYGGDTEQFRKAFAEHAYRLLDRLQNGIGVDTLQIGRILGRRYPAIAKAAASDPNSAFRTAELILDAKIKVKE